MTSIDWWRRRRRWVAQYRIRNDGADPVCVVCGKPWRIREGHLHHRSYARLGHETFEDLVPICAAEHIMLEALIEHDPAWRRVPLQQATDLIIKYLRGKVGQQ